MNPNSLGKDIYLVIGLMWLTYVQKFSLLSKNGLDFIGENITIDSWKLLGIFFSKSWPFEFEDIYIIIKLQMYFFYKGIPFYKTSL